MKTSYIGTINESSSFGMDRRMVMEKVKRFISLNTNAFIEKSRDVEGIRVVGTPVEIECCNDKYGDFTLNLYLAKIENRNENRYVGDAFIIEDSLFVYGPVDYEHHERVNNLDLSEVYNIVMRGIAMRMVDGKDFEMKRVAKTDNRKAMCTFSNFRVPKLNVKDKVEFIMNMGSGDGCRRDSLFADDLSLRGYAVWKWFSKMNIEDDSEYRYIALSISDKVKENGATNEEIKKIVNKECDDFSGKSYIDYLRKVCDLLDEFETPEMCEKYYSDTYEGICYKHGLYNIFSKCDFAMRTAGSVSDTSKVSTTNVDPITVRVETDGVADGYVMLDDSFVKGLDERERKLLEYSTKGSRKVPYMEMVFNFKIRDFELFFQRNTNTIRPMNTYKKVLNDVRGHGGYVTFCDMMLLNCGNKDSYDSGDLENLRRHNAFEYICRKAFFDKMREMLLGLVSKLDSEMFRNKLLKMKMRVLNEVLSILDDDGIEISGGKMVRPKGSRTKTFRF